LIKISQGDYGPDKYRERFPKFEGADTGETPVQLFKRWVAERQPAVSTVETWQYVFREMEADFKGRSVASISPEEAQQWIRARVTKGRSARTVRGTDIRASNSVFGWALEHKYIPRNSFKEVKVTVPKQRRLRETQAFLPQEYRAILKAALAISDTSKPFEAAKRWVPWLMAYTGARPTEITQLRKQDVIRRDGIYAFNFTPEAGSIKSGKARVIPLHEHLVAQGFLKFVESRDEGPLFYKPDRQAKNDDPVKIKKPRSAQVRQRLAKWIADLGVKVPGLQPNHAWRHTFKQIADRAGITERTSDSITGHAHRTVGAGYGEPTLEDKEVAMKKFPTYKLD
jgi:integrase